MIRRLNKTSIRTVKTLHTPVYDGKQFVTRQYLLHHIALLDKVLNATSYNKSILYTGKYKKLPQLITSQDSVRVNNVVRDMLESLQMDEAFDQQRQRDPSSKLGKIGLQLFMDCHQNNITPVSTSLTKSLTEQFNRYPERTTIVGIEEGISEVRQFLREKKIQLREPWEIDPLVDKLAHLSKDAETIKKVLSLLDYKLFADDIVRVNRGKKTTDEIDISKGWKYPTGIVDTNDAYLRSLQFSKKNLITINRDSLVLVYDGTLRDAGRILPSLHYAAKQEKSLLLIVTGDCTGDALTSITINNNKNKRKGIQSETVVMKYLARDHNNTQLQENLDLIRFLKLPLGLGSVYNQDFSEYVPSAASAKQFFGSVESIKATTGEAFLYNTQDADDEINNSSLRTTVTVNVGGESEFEIDQRRAALDNIINNILCHGLAQGFVPSYGVALAKSIANLDAGNVDKSNLQSVGKYAVMESLTYPLENAMNNLYSLDRFSTAKLISQTIADSDFTTAYLDKPTSMVDSGLLEPWDKLDTCLANVTNFIRLISSCDVLVTRFFDKPKRK